MEILRTYSMKINYTLVLILTVLNYAYSQITEITTPNDYSYEYLEDYGFHFAQYGNVTVRVKARNDAHISLSKYQGNWLTDSYEIVIGGWQNQRSAIRKCHQCQPRVEVMNNPLDGNVFLPFWVTWKAGLIRVGSGEIPNVDLMMEWLDEEPHEINYIGLSTGWGAVGYWRFGSVDGGWSAWSVWTECSATCGDGTHERFRMCSNPYPIYGKPCEGDNIDEAVCNVIPCEVDGGWGTWSDWGSCSTTCGSGVQYRERDCDSPPPQYGGAQCEGANEEQLACKLRECPINGGWSSWFAWSVCSTTCGRGERARQRYCNNPAPQYDGLPCSGYANEDEYCFAGNCPINGGWSAWYEWDPCSVTCGAGSQSRHRTCDNPPPQNNGLDCEGSGVEVQQCRPGECPIDGGWSSWTSWGACSLTCGYGVRRRSRSCTNPLPQYGGQVCVGTIEEEERCLEIMCQIHGGWSEWTEWSSCSVTCGDGTQRRSRECNNPSPQFGGEICGGEKIDERQCFDDYCPVDGGWSDWSEWTSCTTTCGDGRRSRTRRCDNPKPEYGGSPCLGDNVESAICFEMDCPVNGSWSAWETWSACGATCGPGTRSRQRTCSNPPPMFNGEECDGNSNQVEECTFKDCAVDGGWSVWGNWSICSVTCGPGHITRSRHCNNPQPAHGGLDCVGESIEFQDCDDVDCPVDGGYTLWSPWTFCSVTCGPGWRLRQRWCANPPQYNGGEPCEGASSQTTTCLERHCPIDGDWTPWSPWSRCTVTCNGGTRSRRRTCTFPPPQYEGNDCLGESDQIMSCNIEVCPVLAQWTNWEAWSACSVECDGGTMNRTRECVGNRTSDEECLGSDYQNRTCNIVSCQKPLYTPEEEQATEAPASAVIGTSVYGVLGVIGVIIVLMDIATIYDHIPRLKRNLNDFRTTMMIMRMNLKNGTWRRRKSSRKSKTAFNDLSGSTSSMNITANGDLKGSNTDISSQSTPISNSSKRSSVCKGKVKRVSLSPSDIEVNVMSGGKSSHAPPVVRAERKHARRQSVAFTATGHPMAAMRNRDKERDAARRAKAKGKAKRRKQRLLAQQRQKQQQQQQLEEAASAAAHDVGEGSSGTTDTSVPNITVLDQNEKL